MKNILALMISLFLGVAGISQTYNCADSLKPIYSTSSTYSVDSFSNETPVEINITSIFFHGHEIKMNFTYKNEIEFESPLMPVTDSVAVKLVLAKVEEYGQKKYMYSLIMYYKEEHCWIEENSSGDVMFVVITKEFKLAGAAVGQPNTPYYIRINEGSIKLN
jgi:hypothetical protein